MVGRRRRMAWCRRHLIWMAPPTCPNGKQHDRFHRLGMSPVPEVLWDCGRPYKLLRTNSSFERASPDRGCDSLLTLLTDRVQASVGAIDVRLVLAALRVRPAPPRQVPVASPMARRTPRSVGAPSACAAAATPSWCGPPAS